LVMASGEREIRRRHEQISIVYSLEESTRVEGCIERQWFKAFEDLIEDLLPCTRLRKIQRPNRRVLTNSRDASERWQNCPTSRAWKSDHELGFS